jgi:hypothetical protein
LVSLGITKKFTFSNKFTCQQRKQQATASVDILDVADEGQNIKINGIAQSNSRGLFCAQINNTI